MDENVTSAGNGAVSPLSLLYLLYRRYDGCHPIFCFQGKFSDELTASILNLSEYSMQGVSTQPLINRKVSFLLVECFQNVVRHSTSVTQNGMDATSGIFAFRNYNHYFIINSINDVPEESAGHLENLVENVNAVQGRNLKDMYLHQLEHNTLDSQGGAGLGLIELARKSGNKLLYKFTKNAGGLVSFHQQVSLLQKKVKSTPPPFDMLSDTEWLLSHLAHHHALLFYKGELSQKTILSILTLVEQNAKEGGIFSRKVGHVLIELLQNIARHSNNESAVSDGIFMICQRDDKTRIIAGNVIDDRARIVLKEKLEFLKGMSAEELKNLHQIAIKASLQFENKNKSGLGLIEVTMASEGNVNYTFDPIDDGHYLFGMDVLI
jgi:hypothetical protein